MTSLASLTQRLAAFDTPTICNVIELFDVRPRNRGYMDARIKATYPELPPMCGFAVTASFRSDALPAEGGAYGNFSQLIEQFAGQPGPAVVVIEDLDDPAVSAAYGEVMCSSFQGFGSAGLVTSGAGRDIEQVRGLKYPVFSGSTICSHGYCHLLHLGMPVRVGGLMVNQGELLHGDANGVTNIPLDIASDVADASAEYIAAESLIIDYVKAPGEKSIAKFNELRSEFAAAVEKLKNRVAR